ncbi:MAG: bacillithiol biosynthesis cysteine-adding enzyme BshC [Flavisolibacter sp.]
MFVAETIPYHQTHAFSRIMMDYLAGAETLRPFYESPASLQAFKETIGKKQKQPVNRKVLVDVLQKQYEQIATTETVRNNIASLISENTFTVCTAHQPNLFTGPLYFIYKILHTIRLADRLHQELPQYHFVPVYYMGSEDADFAELNHTYVGGKKIEWKKEQKGAVGRMLVDGTLLRLVDELEGQLAQEVFGREVIALLRKCYAIGRTIQSATFELVNELYGAYGLVVLIPDHPDLKALMHEVFLKDLLHHSSSSIVQQTSEKLGEHYSVQAHPREINLFYLKENIRERIIRDHEGFLVSGMNMRFSEKEMLKELELHPDRFSPNVILRGLYQESILPNLAFVGGGGELAYWLQLKDLFHHYKVVYPILVLRNSFLIVENKWKEKVEKMGLRIPHFFESENELMKMIVGLHSQNKVSLNGNFERAVQLFEQIRSQASGVDPSLSQHVASIQARSLKSLQELEKKMLRAEKRKFVDQQRQISNIKSVLFPNNGLQERVENFSGFYAKWGEAFIDELYHHSLSLEQEFTILYQRD